MNMIRYTYIRVAVAVWFTVLGFFLVTHQPNNIFQSETKYSSLWNKPSGPVRPVNPSLLDPNHSTSAPKVILFWTPFFGGKFSYFGEEGDRLKICPVSNCILTDDRHLLSSSDALIFHPMDVDILPEYRNPDQYWIYFVLESPLHVPSSPPGMYNLTFTYRLDSDIIADNYLQYFNFPTWDHDAFRKRLKRKTKNSAVMFLSNCNAPSKRQEYVNYLKQHYPVDVYGACGEKLCPKADKRKCDEIVQDYKFYLAFENSICTDYVTEKIIRSFNAGVVPVVMGGANYSAIFPPNSFINVMDFESPRKLADHLQTLSDDLTLYERYLRWRTDPKFVTLPDYLSYEKVSLCKLCELVHAKVKIHKTYDDLNDWFVSGGNCRDVQWKLKT